MSEKSRSETLLEALANGVNVDITPLSRNEVYLKALLDGNKDVPVPQSRIEAYLHALCEKGTGGGDEQSVLDALIDGTLTEIEWRGETIRRYCFQYHPTLRSGNFPNVTVAGSHIFYSCGVLESINMPKLTTVGESAFQSCKYLADVRLPLLKSIPRFCFNSCEKSLLRVTFPEVTSIDSSAFYSCDVLAFADFPKVTSIASSVFDYAEKLKVLILRSNTLCTLASTSALNKTPIKSGTGYIYVPRALVDSYTSATNWSTFAAQFRALEDYTVDGTTTGALDESKI